MTWDMLCRRIERPSGDAASIGSTAASPVSDRLRSTGAPFTFAATGAELLPVQPARISFTVIPAGYNASFPSGKVILI